MKNDKPVDKKKLIENTKKNISKLTSRERNILAKTVQYDLLKELTANLKNSTSVSEEKWQLLTKKLKNYKRIFNIKDDKFIKYLDILLPLLGALLGALFTFKYCEEEEQKVSLPEIKLPNGKFSSDPDEVLNALQDPNIDILKSSKVMTYCDNKQFGFSKSKITSEDKGGRDGDKGNDNYSDNTKDENKGNDNADCKISMCPPISKTDMDNIFPYDALEMPKGLIVEYDQRYPHRYDINEGQILSFDNPVGMIKDLPVKSKVRGIVTEKNDDYFIVDYVDDMPNMDIEALVDQYQNRKLEELNKLFLNNMAATNFIKDYLYEMRIPDIANHKLGIPLPTAQSIKLYRLSYEVLVKAYETRTKNNCSASNIQAFGRAGNLTGLKKILDDDKKRTFEQIKDFYNNYKTLGFATRGTIGDYMLYDEYMDYITDEERFRYDDENPYVVKLFKLICKFIGTRSKLEKSVSDLPALISKFNSMCKITLKKYWKPSGGNYYADLKRTFQYDYYTNDMENLIQAAETDKDAVTLYSKVKQYLQNKMNYTPPQDKAIEYSENMDVNALLKGGLSGGSSDNVSSEINKIALNFCMLRNIEVSENDNAVFNNGTANQGIVSAFLILDAASGPLLEEFNELMVPVDPIMLAAQAVLRPYLKTLQKVTVSESNELDILAKEVMNWYDANAEKVNDPHIFDSFKEIGWGGESIIYRNNDMYDYVYLTYNEDSGNNEDGNFDFDSGNNDMDYYDSGAYLKAAYGPDSLEYWIKYLSIATVVNCMLPIYWGTGLIITGAPIILPIIMIPMCVINGRVTAVFGIGLCGICPMPMILFVNLGNTMGSMLVPLNILADTLLKSIRKVTNKQQPALEAAYLPVLQSLDENINDYNKKLNDLESEIHNLDSAIKENKKVKRNIKKKKKQDPTTNQSKLKKGSN